MSCFWYSSKMLAILNVLRLNSKLTLLYLEPKKDLTRTSTEETKDDGISHVDKSELQLSIAVCHMSVRKVGILKRKETKL